MFKLNVSAFLMAALLGTGAFYALPTHAAEKEAAKKVEKTEKVESKAVAPAAVEGEGPAIKLGNPVVAKVDGKDVMRSDVFDFIGGLPPQVQQQMPIQSLFPLALDQVVNNMLVGKKAESAKLENDPEVQKILEQTKAQVIRSVYVERQVNAAVSEKDLKSAYDELLTKIEKVDEVRARHILVDSEDKAKEVIAKLGKGSKFEDLVKEYSADNASGADGDLGYFAKDQMVAEFADAAFALDKGAISKAPVKTQFGWHVIKVEDKRPRPQPKFEEVKAQLEASVRQKKLADLVTGWQKEAKIEKFDINGDPVKAEPAPEKKKN